jgi:outer membrane protein
VSVRRFNCVGALRCMVGWGAMVCCVTGVYAFDPFLTNRLIAKTPAAGLLGGGAEVCAFDDLKGPLTLHDAVERAMCNNPKTRQAWANVKIQAAAVGTARAAYLPTVAATAISGALTFP